jgi:hypothetical protein
LRKDRLTRKSAPTTPLLLPSAIACCDDDFEALRLPGNASQSCDYRPAEPDTDSWMQCL